MNRLRNLPFRAWLSGLALAALVALQTLGAMHAIVHAGGHEDVHAHGVAKLFGGHHAGDADCHLYDQLAHADLAPFSTTAPIAVPPSFAPADAMPACVAAAAPRFFQARGPPATA